MTYDTTEQHLALARGTPAKAHICYGDFINLYPSKSHYDSDLLGAEIRKQQNMVPEDLKRKDLLDRDPHLGPPYTFGTIYNEFCWLASPGDYMRDLFDHYRKQGGAFQQAHVVAVTPGETPTITLDGGETLSADKVVVSAGAWSAKMANSLGVRIQLDTERGYHISMSAPSFTAPNTYMVTDAKFVLTPMRGSLRAAGVVEFGGVDAPASKAPVAMISKALKRVYPDLSFDVSESWMGRRPTTPDSLPVIGESQSAPNIVHAYGGQHIGLTIGPKIGRLIANMLSGSGANMDITPYRVDRF